MMLDIRHSLSRLPGINASRSTMNVSHLSPLQNSHSVAWMKSIICIFILRYVANKSNILSPVFVSRTNDRIHTPSYQRSIGWNLTKRLPVEQIGTPSMSLPHPEFLSPHHQPNQVRRGLVSLGYHIIVGRGFYNAVTDMNKIDWSHPTLDAFIHWIIWMVHSTRERDAQKSCSRANEALIASQRP